MSTNKVYKLNKLLQEVPKGAVILSSWLRSKGYSHSLQHRYIKSNWFESIGIGALKRKNDEITVLGALHALQYQGKKDIHIGGISALIFMGFAHYIKLGEEKYSLFAQTGYKLPAWYRQNESWKKHQLVCTSFLPTELAINEYDLGSFKIKISSPARAILECLELAPNNFDLAEVYLIMESLTSLRPNDVQKLLEVCTSIKVKRLFLYFAESANHNWFKYLETDKINLGFGKRSIVNEGMYIEKYRITVPKKLN